MSEANLGRAVLSYTWCHFCGLEPWSIDQGVVKLWFWNKHSPESLSGICTGGASNHSGESNPFQVRPPELYSTRTRSLFSGLLKSKEITGSNLFHLIVPIETRDFKRDFAILDEKRWDKIMFLTRIPTRNIIRNFSWEFPVERHSGNAAL